MKKALGAAALLLCALLLAGFAMGQSAQAVGKKRQDAFDRLSAEQKDKLIELFLQDYPFVETNEFKNFPETLNRFFTMPIYQRLRGNFMRGYLYDEGFEFSGNEIYPKTIKTVTECDSIIRPLTDWMNKVFNSNGIRFVEKEKSGYEMGLCVVSCVPKMSDASYPGVYCEVVLSNRETGKSLFLRFGQGSRQGMDRALVDASTIILTHLLTRKRAQ